MTTLLYISRIDPAEEWGAALARYGPDIDFRVWPDGLGNPADIDYVYTWSPPRGVLASLPNLKAIFSLGAGIDHLTKDPELPHDVPIVRMASPQLTGDMLDYVSYWVMHYHRNMHLFAAQRRERVWRYRAHPAKAERRVGLMGLGVIGRAVAAALAGQGFAVGGWSRGPKEIDGIETFHGRDGLAAFLARTDILITLLPLTPELVGILDAKAFATLPEGACLIHAARGPHLVDADLIATLDSGHLGGATIDVMTKEPPPEDHPFWDHAKIELTPHAASRASPEAAAAMVAEEIARHQSGLPLRHTGDPARGY